MVLRVADREADVVETRGIVQELAIRGLEAVERARPVEERERELGRPFPHGRRRSEPFGERSTLRRRMIGHALRRFDVGAMASDEVEENAFAQRPLTGAQLRHAESLEELLARIDAGRSEIGALAVEAGRSGRASPRRSSRIVLRSRSTSRGVIIRLWIVSGTFPLTSRVRHGHEVEQRARRADHHRRAARAASARKAPRASGARMRLKRLDLPLLRWVRAQEPLRQTNDSELQALLPANLALVAEDHLDAAAADVDDERALVAKVDGVLRRRER